MLSLNKMWDWILSPWREDVASNLDDIFEPNKDHGLGSAIVQGFMALRKTGGKSLSPVIFRAKIKFWMYCPPFRSRQDAAQIVLGPGTKSDPVQGTTTGWVYESPTEGVYWTASPKDAQATQQAAVSRAVKRKYDKDPWSQGLNPGGKGKYVQQVSLYFKQNAIAAHGVNYGRLQNDRSQWWTVNYAQNYRNHKLLPFYEKEKELTKRFEGGYAIYYNVGAENFDQFEHVIFDGICTLCPIDEEHDPTPQANEIRVKRDIAFNGETIKAGETVTREVAHKLFREKLSRNDRYDITLATKAATAVLFQQWRRWDVRDPGFLNPTKDDKIAALSGMPHDDALSIFSNMFALSRQVGGQGNYEMRNSWNGYDDTAAEVISITRNSVTQDGPVIGGADLHYAQVIECYRQIMLMRNMCQKENFRDVIAEDMGEPKDLNKLDPEIPQNAAILDIRVAFQSLIQTLARDGGQSPAEALRDLNLAHLGEETQIEGTDVKIGQILKFAYLISDKNENGVKKSPEYPPELTKRSNAVLGPEIVSNLGKAFRRQVMKENTGPTPFWGA